MGIPQGNYSAIGDGVIVDPPALPFPGRLFFDDAVPLLHDHGFPKGQIESGFQRSPFS